MLKKLILISCLLLTGCTNPNDVAINVLEALDYSNIKITGYRWFACSNDDFYSTGFTATTSSGKKVTGTVCSGIFFKNSTVRYG